MTTIDYIKGEIKRLFDEGTEIHLSVKMTHPKVYVQDMSAKIRGVYPNIFRIEEIGDGGTGYHSVQYNDILIGRVSIAELPVDTTPARSASPREPK